MKTSALLGSHEKGEDELYRHHLHYHSISHTAGSCRANYLCVELMFSEKRVGRCTDSLHTSTLCLASFETSTICAIYGTQADQSMLTSTIILTKVLAAICIM